MIRYFFAKNAGRWMFLYTKRRLGPHNAQYDLSLKLCSASSPCHLKIWFQNPSLEQTVQEDSYTRMVTASKAHELKLSLKTHSKAKNAEAAEAYNCRMQTLKS